MNYGFLIDNRKCIGCHACSTACKSENEVPLGVNRTWVKYTEKGVFPDTRRYFQVTRCNHCANPPCVHICPVTAMYQRGDGIVEFDPARCIGCKACMQACPYDAIYIDPDTHTAAKCHYCAHRVDVGLEPACVVVCPEHAILAGDLDDPHSEIARAVATQQVRVRKPEQGTQPKLFYINAEEASITPTLAAQGRGLLWAPWPDHGLGGWGGPLHIGEGAGRQAWGMGAGRFTSARAREAWRAPCCAPPLRRARRTTSRTGFRGTGRCPRTWSPKPSERAHSSSPPLGLRWACSRLRRFSRRLRLSFHSSSSASTPASSSSGTSWAGPTSPICSSGPAWSWPCFRRSTLPSCLRRPKGATCGRARCSRRTC